MRIPLVNLPKEHSPYQAELDRGIRRVVASGGYIGGEEVRAFEEELAYYLGLEPWSVISCGNGSDALLLALAALDLPRGGEVIVATHNYVAAAEAVCHLGLRPVWADVMPSPNSDGRVSFQMNGSLDYLESLRTPRTVALIAVNMYGMPCPADELTHFCKRHQIPWIEDNAQGMGGVVEKVSGCLRTPIPLGTRATIGTTSFFPTKPLGCMGDGGAAFVPHDQLLAERLRQLANHGQHTRYQYEQCGYNSRLDALQAAVLRVKLGHLDEANRRRRLLADRYDELLADLPMVKRPWRSGDQPEALYLYTICVPSDKRDGLLNELRTAGIDARVYYPQMLHQIAAYRADSSEASCPVAEALQQTMLSLPIAPTTTSEQISEICERIRQFLL
ncbi:DegT/DnrJ/EryC1/StrS family aminotransferase [uncultured Porphyromonas sp.]|uniref:DegT/DnrJ/EryC1/StrS family aminotransferase n=1 Tax=uncultured Porphyromonas sp. TaxID=159274 RepID=UPI00262D9112|nr:DegT/DnrJ/EryC1/StrS family aminotransferase [uncultured Porphyromonas sp.]